MADSSAYDDNYYTLKVWRDPTQRNFIRLKSMRQLRMGVALDNVKFLDMIISEALEREEKSMRKDNYNFGEGETA